MVQYCLAPYWYCMPLIAIASWTHAALNLPHYNYLGSPAANLGLVWAAKHRVIGLDQLSVGQLWALSLHILLVYPFKAVQPTYEILAYCE